jgi:hypothetical protein
MSGKLSVLAISIYLSFLAIRPVQAQTPTEGNDAVYG